jgi:hypothetical protein
MFSLNVKNKSIRACSGVADNKREKLKGEINHLIYKPLKIKKNASWLLSLDRFVWSEIR